MPSTSDLFFMGGSGVIGCIADMNLMYSGTGRIPETPFGKAYLNPFIHPLILNEWDTLFHILSANI